MNQEWQARLTRARRDYARCEREVQVAKEQHEATARQLVAVQTACNEARWEWERVSQAFGSLLLIKDEA